MKKTELVDTLVRGTVEGLGYQLYDVEFAKESGNWVLTLYIDKEGGISIDDCEAVNNAVEPILDEHDPIPQQYYLSVSSIGLDRPLKKDADYRRNLGNKISWKLFAPHSGRKEFTGVLLEYDADTALIDTGTEQIRLERREIAQAKPVIEF